MSLYVFTTSLIFALVLLLPISAGADANKPVNRILSLDLCTDWMLAKYVNPSQVLALSHLMHQYPVDWINQEWPTHNGSLEQILELKPDLVITGEYNALILRRRLQELGTRVEILSLPKNLSQITDYEKRFLSLLNIPIHKVSKPPQIRSDNHQKHKPTLLLLGPNGIGTGRKTFENDILELAGWKNYLTSDGYINLDLEQIAVNPPDAALWFAPDTIALANLFAEHPVLKQAIPEQRWLSTERWRWQCPGPWTRDLIELLQTQLQKRH